MSAFLVNGAFSVEEESFEKTTQDVQHQLHSAAAEVTFQGGKHQCPVDYLWELRSGGARLRASVCLAELQQFDLNLDVPGVGLVTL